MGTKVSIDVKDQPSHEGNTSHDCGAAMMVALLSVGKRKANLSHNSNYQKEIELVEVLKKIGASTYAYMFCREMWRLSYSRCCRSNAVVPIPTQRAPTQLVREAEMFWGQPQNARGESAS